MKLLLILSLILAFTWSLPTELTTDDFSNGKVTTAAGETSGAWFVEFYNPRCPHCKKFSPTWDQLADDFSRDPINFGKLDCIKYKPVCDRFNIWGVPTLLMFRENHVSEYESHNDYDSVAKYLNTYAYNNDALGERWPVPAA